MSDVRPLAVLFVAGLYAMPGATAAHAQDLVSSLVRAADP